MLKSAMLPKSHRWLLLLSILLVLLPHVTRLPIWLGLLCLAILIWRYCFDIGKCGPIPSWLRLGVTIGGSLGVWFGYETLIGREPGSALLIMMLCLKLTELRGERDIYQCVFLSYFVVVIGFLFSQSIWMGIYMFMVVLSVTASLVAYAHIPEREHVSQKYTFTYLRIATKLLLQSLPLGLILFVLFPRLPGPLWSLPEDSYSGRTGLSDNMAPGNISHLLDSDAVAFRVIFRDKVPDPKQLYWRGPVFWHFDGRRWSNPNAHIRNLRKLSFRARGERIDYTITLEPHDRRWLFALDVPAQVPVDAYITPELQLMSNQPVNQLLRYPISSYDNYTLEADQSPSAANVSVPRSVAPEARKLVRDWLAQTTQAEKIVQMALAYFNQNPFYYTRNPPRLLNDPIDEFLFSTRKGYCEHFASSFTVLMRLAGIPARVVTGYQGGEMNPMADYMIVRQSLAHAWSEVWLQGKGWVRFDPTAVIPESRVEDAEDLERIQPFARRVLIAKDLGFLAFNLQRVGFAWDALNNRWNQWVVGFNDQRQHNLMQSLGFKELSNYGLVVLLALFSTVFAIIVSVLLLRTKRESRPAALRYYLRFCSRLAKRGLARGQGEGALAFSARVRQRFPELGPLVSEITDDYYQIRYAGNEPQVRLRRLKQNVRRV